MPQRPTRSRFRQFSLRTGVIFFLLISVVFGIAAHLYHDVIKRGEVQRLIAEHGDTGIRGFYRSKPLSYSYAPETNVSEWTKFLRKRVHAEYERKYKSLRVRGDPLPIDPRLDLSLIFGAEELTLSEATQPKSILMAFGIKGLKNLVIFHSQLKESTPTDWRGISRTSDLEELTIDGPPVSRGFAEGLATLPKLHRLSITAISADAFPPLCKIKNLAELHMPWAQGGGVRDDPKASANERRLFTDGFNELAQREKLTLLSLCGRFPLEPSDIREFCSKSKLTTLKLQWTELNPQCIKELARLPNLEEIDIHESHVADNHLQWLADSKSLKKIRIAIGPKNSGSAILELKEKMPHCNISRN